MCLDKTNRDSLLNIRIVPDRTSVVNNFVCLTMYNVDLALTHSASLVLDFVLTIVR